MYNRLGGNPAAAAPAVLGKLNNEYIMLKKKTKMVHRKVQSLDRVGKILCTVKDAEDAPQVGEDCLSIYFESKFGNASMVFNYDSDKFTRLLESAGITGEDGEADPNEIIGRKVVVLWALKVKAGHKYLHALCSYPVEKGTPDFKHLSKSEWADYGCSENGVIGGASRPAHPTEAAADRVLAGEDVATGTDNIPF